VSVTFINGWFGGWAVADGYVTTAPANHSVDIPVSGVTSGHWLIAAVGWHTVPQIETTITVGDDAANYWVPIATSYTDGSSLALNPNWAFSSGSSSWTVADGTLTSATNIMYGSHAKSLKITPAGNAAIGFVNFSGGYVAVTGGNLYTVTFWMFSPTGYQSVQVGIAQENSSHTYFGSLLGSYSFVPPNTWTPVTYTVAVSSTCAYASPQVLMRNGPQPWDIMYVGQATLSPGGGFSSEARVAIWAAPNVSPPTNVAISPLGQVTGLNARIMEFSGFPTWLDTDAISTTFVNNSSTAKLSLTPTQSDFILTAAVDNNVSYPISRLATGWSATTKWSSFTNGTDTVGDTYLLASWTTSGSPTSVTFYATNPINTNPLFVSNTTGWQAVNSTIALSSTPVYSTATTHNMKITPNGTSSVVGASITNATAPAVTPGLTYFAEAYLHAPFASGNVSATVTMTWQTSGHAAISSLTSAISTVVGATSATWYNAVVQGQAPATAAFATMTINLRGHLAATRIVNVGRASLNKASNANVGIGAAMVGFQLTPTIPSQPNSTWPDVHFEVAFGQASGTAPDQLVWTDISDRLLSWSLDRGRQYELNSLESAQLTMALRNDDGKLTPGSSAAGAYQVEVYSPARITARWQGKIYGIYRGYIERWPQSWEDIHFGIVPAIGVDAWAMFVTTLRSILQNEILLDNPFGYWPCGDAKGQTTAINLGTFPGNGQFSLASTKSLIGTTTSASATFGADTMPLVGDAGTCWNMNGLTSSQANLGYSLQYTGPYLPPLTLNPTITWRAFPIYTGPAPVPGNRLAIMTLNGQNNNPVISVWMDSGTGIHVTTWNATTGAQTDHTPSSSFGYSFNTIYFLLLTPTTFTLYIGGTDTLTGTENFQVNVSSLTMNGRRDNLNHGQFGNISISHVAYFPRPLDYSRFVTYSFSATNGMAGDFGDWRVSRLLSYIGWSQAARIFGDGSDQQMAGATDIAGNDVATAINNIAQTEQALNYVDRNGYIVYRTRQHALDRSSQATFGQNVTGGEIPYLISLQLDYDPQYISNDIQMTHQGTPPFSATGEAQSASTSVSITLTNQSSVNQYSDRSLQLTSYFSDVSQSINLTNWLINQYSYPHMRVAQVEVTPASNPTLFAKLLSLDIGDFVTLKMTPIGANNTIKLPVMIIGMHHDVEWKAGKWVMRFDIMPQQIAALQSVTLKLNDAVLGKLDSGNVIGW